MPGVPKTNREGAATRGARTVEFDRRRSERLLLTVPILVEGLDSHGGKFSENARTLLINRHGAWIQLKRPISVGSTLHITTLVGKRSADFRVIGPTRPPSDAGGEWGVECLAENSNIWGITFPPSPKGQAFCSALLECHHCHTVGLAHLSVVEHDVLRNSGLLTRECQKCGQATSWSLAERTAGTIVPDNEIDSALRDVLEAPPPSGNRRLYPRVALKLPIRVRSYYGIEEIARTENVSKGGFCFISDKSYQVKEVVLVTCPYERGAENIEMRGQVVRFSDLAGTGHKVYGICYQR
jgi:hypothetical protein